MKNQLTGLLESIGRLIKYGILKTPRKNPNIDLYVTMPGGLPRKDGDK
jgi:hypothetical protein